MYNKIQQQVVSHVRERVRILFKNYPVPAHGFDHVSRVRNWAVKIAKAESVNVFLCELAAWFHDIGRVEEKKRQKPHHEVSYEMCREWFKTDRVFDLMTAEEKLIILYAVRYHWNDMANQYDVAWILRDADKLDGFGIVGVRRAQETCHGDFSILSRELRFCANNLLYLRTKIAKKMMEERDLFEPIRKLNEKVLLEHIFDVKL